MFEQHIKFVVSLPVIVDGEKKIVLSKVIELPSAFLVVRESELPLTLTLPDGNKLTSLFAVEAYDLDKQQGLLTLRTPYVIEPKSDVQLNTFTDQAEKQGWCVTFLHSPSKTLSEQQSKQHKSWQGDMFGRLGLWTVSFCMAFASATIFLVKDLNTMMATKGGVVHILFAYLAVITLMTPFYALLLKFMVWLGKGMWCNLERGK